MYCMRCGATINIDDNFCRSCGEPSGSTSNNTTSEHWKNKNPSKIEFDLNKKSSFLKKWWLVILICIVFFIYSMVRKDLVNIYVKENVLSNNDPWLIATKEFEDIKKQQKLPIKTDQYTVFKDMFVRNREVHYVYSISNMPLTYEIKDAFSKETLTLFKKNLCQNPLIVEHGGKMVFTYQFLTGDLVYSYDKRNCLK